MSLPEPFVPTLTKWSDVYMRRSMRNFFLYARQNGFSITQIAALFFIYRKGSNSVSDIRDELGITNAAASQMLERLVQLQLIQRSEDPHDRRCKEIVLTDKGRQVLQDSIYANQSWFGNLASTLSETEKEQVVTGLELLIEKAEKLDLNPI